MTMTERRSDPLLRGTRLLLGFTIAVSAIAGIGAAIAVPAMWIFRSHIDLDGITMTTETVAALSAIALLLSAVCFIAIAFLRRLVAIIDSVKDGSPFIPENALRLRTMGWLVLGMEAMVILAAPLSVWIKQVNPESHFIISFDFGWLITALLLFILARVFDQGTKLAEDVEGTV